MKGKDLSSISKRSVAIVIAFQIFFFVVLVVFRDIYIVPSRLFRNTSPEYWNWFQDVWHPQHSLGTLELVPVLVKWVFLVLFLVCFWELLSKKEFRTQIRKKQMSYVCVAAVAIYVMFFVYNKYVAAHYHLVMTLISAELISLVLLAVVLSVERARVGVHGE